MRQSSALYDPRRSASPRQIKEMDKFHQRRLRFEAAAVAPKPDAPVIQAEVVNTEPDVPSVPTVTSQQIEEAWSIFERMGFDGLHPSVASITREVCRYFLVEKTDLISARRTKNLVVPRQVAMYLCKILTRKSLPEIGRRFGDRDHTTVLHAVRKMEYLVSRNDEVSKIISDIRSKLQGNVSDGVA